MESIISKNIINLKDAINEIILNSSDAQLKSFYNSTIGRFIFDALEISHSSFNYTAYELVDELNLSTAKSEENVIRLANEHSYHLKHKIPASVKCRVNILDVNDERWNAISNIELVGGTFTSLIGNYQFMQLTNVPFNKSNRTDFEMVQCYKKELNFTIYNKMDWTTIKLDNTENITNYFNTGLNLDAKLYLIESNGNEIEYTVLRTVPTESDLETRNFVLTKVNEDKTISLIFGNGSFGNRGYGNYRFEFFETFGATANFSTPMKTKLAFQKTGINIYDINGKIIENAPYINDLVEIYTVSDIDGGEDIDNIEDIRNKAMYSSALNNTLLNSDDYNYYIKNYYSINDVYFWGDNEENKIRQMARKENFNLTFFSSPTLKYDFDLSKNIRYNLMTDKIGVTNNLKNNVAFFDIIPDCDRYAHRRIDDCLSFKTLYILGRIKPIAYYYSMLYDENSLICNMMDNLKSKSVETSMVYVESDKLNVNIMVNVSGNLSLSDNEMKSLIIEQYNSSSDKTDFDGAVRNGLAGNNININSINITPIFNLTRFNTDLNAIMVINEVNEFERYVVMDLVSKFGIALGTYYKMSSCLNAISIFVDELLPHLVTAEKVVIKSILSYCLNKYNETKYNVIQEGKFNAFDIPLIQFIISNITFIRG